MKPIDESSFSALHKEAECLYHQLPFMSCAILQRKLHFPYGLARKILEEMRANGYSVLEEKDLIANPKIKIVFVDNAGSESICEIIKKAHPNIDVIQVNTRNKDDGL